uniref:Uncharacterized protein n=1 Tax=Rhinopithecus bieti TaxID=61621 RepID=A0A2K6LY27_RHIBE
MQRGHMCPWLLNLFLTVLLLPKLMTVISDSAGVTFPLNAAPCTGKGHFVQWGLPGNGFMICSFLELGSVVAAALQAKTVSCKLQ